MVVLSVVSILLYSVMLYYGLVLSFGKLSFVRCVLDKSSVVYEQNKHMCGGENSVLACWKCSFRVQLRCKVNDFRYPCVRRVVVLVLHNLRCCDYDMTLCIREEKRFPDPSLPPPPLPRCSVAVSFRC